MLNLYWKRTKLSIVDSLKKCLSNDKFGINKFQAPVVSHCSYLVVLEEKSIIVEENNNWNISFYKVEIIETEYLSSRF